MELKIDESLIQISISCIHESLKKKADKGQKSLQGQALSTELFAFLSQQILIPILVSLSSCALYDILKGKVLSRISSNESQRMINNFQQVTINTSIPLSEECMKMLLDELSPLGISEDDITIMYEQIKYAIENHKKKNMHDENNCSND